jgi:hypothetical protein
MDGALEVYKLPFKVCAVLLTAIKRRKNTNEKRGTASTIESPFYFFLSMRDKALRIAAASRSRLHLTNWVWSTLLLLATAARSRRSAVFALLLLRPGPTRRQGSAN